MIRDGHQLCRVQPLHECNLYQPRLYCNVYENPRGRFVGQRLVFFVRPENMSASVDPTMTGLRRSSFLVLRGKLAAPRLPRKAYFNLLSIWLMVRQPRPPIQGSAVGAIRTFIQPLIIITLRAIMRLIVGSRHQCRISAINAAMMGVMGDQYVPGDSLRRA